MGGYLKAGRWISADEWETDDEGSFQRHQSKFRERVEPNPEAKFAAASGRYHLFVSLACPWAHRTLLVRALKGLESAIGVSVVNPVMRDDGWIFGTTPGEPEPELLTKQAYLRDIYLKADPNFTGRVTVPVLWDIRHSTIVSNESRDVISMLDTEFQPWAEREFTLYPTALRDTIERTLDAIYEPINNGVYKAGFAATQSAYEQAFHELFDALDHYESVLGKQRYLCGDQLTAADICMFTTLLRFDPVYYVHFKCNLRRIVDYPHLSGYLRELYQLPHVAGQCNFAHIKQHYYQSHPRVNPMSLVPVGPDLSWLSKPHDRNRLGGGPPSALF